MDRVSFFICEVKVLILHQHFKSPAAGGAIRSYYLAKALVDRGLQVTVITGSNENDYREETMGGIEVHHLPIAYENAFGFVKRSVSFLVYAWKSVRLAKKMQNIDVCYAISTPLTVGLAAMRLKAKRKLPFIFEVGDLWPDAPVQMGIIKNSIFAAALYRLERSIYQKAESIVALSQPIKNSIENKAPGVKINVIPNFADCDFYLPESKNPASEKKYSVQGKFVVSYIGAVGFANGLDFFIECANGSRKACLPIQFILCGEGAMLEPLKSTVKKQRIENISITGFVDRNTVKEIMNITDAVFVSYRNVPILETGSPNKYFDGLASGKLIVTNFGGWIKNEIEQMACGVAVDPTQPTDFIKKIIPFINDPKKLAEYQTAARKLAEEKYHRKKLSSLFADIFIKRRTQR
jgi:glycosyltransferase involved in cell wall biosynthesis